VLINFLNLIIMLKNILELEGAKELSKQQQKAVNGGKKCESVPLEMEALEVEAGIQTCAVRCRPSFLGIGFGSWSLWEDVPC
jgi:hypothetical protein